MSKKLCFISIVLLVMVFNLGQSQIAQAEEAPQPTIFPFTHVYGEPLSVSAANFIPEIDDEVVIFYALPVTEALLDEMLQAAAQGYTPAIEFQTRGSIEITGYGSGGYSARVFAAIEHADGSLMMMDSETEIVEFKQGNDMVVSRETIRDELAEAVSDGTSIFVEKTERYIAPLDDWVNSMEVGDTLVVAGMAQGWASSGSESGDFVRVNWSIAGDPDRPIVTGSLDSFGSE